MWCTSIDIGILEVIVWKIGFFFLLWKMMCGNILLFYCLENKDVNF